MNEHGEIQRFIVMRYSDIRSALASDYIFGSTYRYYNILAQKIKMNC